MGQKKGSSYLRVYLMRSPELLDFAVPHCMSFADLTSNLEKDVENVYGKPDPARNTVRNARRIIVKV